jgi:hypothetical protein
MNAYKLPWPAEAIAQFAERTLRQRAGTWVFGVYGAVAEFMIDPCEAAEIVSDHDEMTALTARGALRLRKHGKTIAFAIGRRDIDGGPRAIGLALPRPLGLIEARSSLHALGPDEAAISLRHRNAFLYDLGLGHGVARFCIRTDLMDFKTTLDAEAGASWKTIMRDIGQEMLRVSPHCVVESAMGRIEVYAAIPRPHETSPAGPHTHLLPTLLAMSRETLPDWDLPPIFAPCAMFYPDSAASFADLQPA